MKLHFRNPFKIRWIQNSLLILFSSLFSFILIDLTAFYGLGLKYPGYGGEAFYQFNSITGYTPTPNYSNYWYTYRGEPGVFVSINSFGFTDIEHSLKKTKPRIALMGDSVMQSWEIEENKRPHNLLKPLLSNQYDVLNYGIRGYGLDQTYLYFRQVGSKFKPDIVVLYFCINDINDSVDTYQKPYFVIDHDEESGLRLQGIPVQELVDKERNKRDISWSDISLFFYNRSICYREIGGFVNRTIINRVKRRVFGLTSQKNIKSEIPPDLRPYKKIYNDEDNRRLEITLKILLQINTIMNEQEIRFLLVEGLDKQAQSGHWKKMNESRYGNLFDYTKITTVLNEFTQNHNIEFLSLPYHLMENNLRIDEMMYHTDHLHFNHNGAEFFSTNVYNKLQSLGWIDQ